MNFTITTIAQSLADYLAPVLPGVTMFEDPNQQGTTTPAMFLQQRYSYIQKQTDGYYIRRIGLDLTYLEDYNLPDLHQKYLLVAEALDLVMDTFPYSDGSASKTTRVRAYDREWRVDLDALHYKFELRERVTAKEAAELMKKMDLNITVKEGFSDGQKGTEQN